MLIDEQFRKSVAFLYVDDLDDETTPLTTKRIPAATAVMVAVPIGSDGSVLYAVTNVHVVNECRSFGMGYLRINLRSPQLHHDLPIDPDSWVCHPTTDVAVARIPTVSNWDHVHVPFEMLASNEYVLQHRVGPGDEIFFVGLFTDHPGLERMQPILRFGQLAMMPHDKVSVRLDRASDPVQVSAYLVEAKSVGGQSGSPAFIHYAADRLNTGAGGNVMLNTAIPPALLGIVSGHFDVRQPVTLVGDVEPVGNVKINAGMAIVIPAQAIIDVLNMEELMEDREAIAKVAMANVPVVSSDPALAGQRSEFQRFEDLARRVVAVPKSDIDAERLEG